MNKSTFIIALLTVFAPLFLQAQGWEKTYDGGHDENVFAADRALDGGVIMAGTQINETTGLDVPFIYKTDIDGNLQWELYKTEAENAFVRTDGVHALSDGNILLSFSSSQTTSNDTSVTIQKLNSAGNIIWSTDIDVNTLGWVREIEETASGDIFIVGGYMSAPPAIQQSTRILKLNSTGDVQWTHGVEASTLPYWPGGFAICSDGGIATFGYYGYFNADQNAFSIKMDNDGNILWEKEYDKTGNQFAVDGVELPNGEFLVSGMEGSEIGVFDAALYKLDSIGNEIWFQTYPEFGSQNILNIKPTPDGNIVMAGNTDGIGAGEKDLYLMKLDTAGTILWTNTFGRGKKEIYANVMVTANNEFYIAGYTEKLDNTIDAYLVKTDSLGNSITNELSGILYFDENDDCLLDPNEIGMSQWLIEAEKGNENYFALTDSTGNYSFTLDTGTYNITVTPISPYWELCDSTFDVSFSNFFDTIEQHIPAQPIVDCPLLDISIATPVLRRCFENTYYVHYCNYGTIVAEDASVEIILDPFMEFLNSSIPLDTQNGDTLTFLLEDVNLGDCGDFTFNVFLEETGLPCDSIILGQTHCVEAHIFPDSICLPGNSWSGASIEVDAVCEGDSIFFYIENVGNTATQPNLQYFVIEDDVILYEGTFNLNQGEVETIAIFTNGSTFRLVAEQEPNHPGMSMPSVSVEGCGDEFLIFSFGFVNIFAQDDANPFVDIDCRQNIGAYDPNDKIGFPIGYDDENYINQGQDIEYMVRFQNTGTDTAFTVVIRDKLSEFLDISSVRPGASSHPYGYDISGDGTLVFTFDNIMLPDSNVNEAASHGFVEFKVAQKPNLELETQIKNSAGIYFDFNAPVITNETLHTIGENIFTVSVGSIEIPHTNVTVFPNPFNHFTNIEIEGLEIEKGEFKIYDITGRLLRKEHFNSNKFVLDKRNLQAGMYFFTIENANQLIASGKIVAQ